jgi:hypothetical protein
MAHYAFLDQDQIVTEVIVGVNEHELIEGKDPETWYGQFRGQVCKRTSYNTKGGVHIQGGTPFRKNYAGIGFIYDESRDAFIPPKPFESWTLNEATCLWDAPVPYPNDGNDYQWDESAGDWFPINEELLDSN